HYPFNKHLYTLLKEKSVLESYLIEFNHLVICYVCPYTGHECVCRMPGDFRVICLKDFEAACCHQPDYQVFIFKNIKTAVFQIPVPVIFSRDGYIVLHVIITHGKLQHAFSEPESPVVKAHFHGTKFHDIGEVAIRPSFHRIGMQKCNVPDNMS